MCLLYPRLLVRARAACAQCGPSVARSGNLLPTRQSCVLCCSEPLQWTQGMRQSWCHGRGHSDDHAEVLAVGGWPMATSERCAYTCSEGWALAADPVLLWERGKYSSVRDQGGGSGGIIHVNHPGVTNNHVPRARLLKKWTLLPLHCGPYSRSMT